MARWQKTMSEEGALTAALNYYRAAISLPGTVTEKEYPPVTVPVKGVWSEGDCMLGESQMLTSDACAQNWEYTRVNDASHWLQLDQPEVVNQLILDFIQQH